MSPFYSVVIPFYNEEASIPDLLSEVLQVMDGLGRPYEVLCVDDGSRDGTAACIRTLADRPSPVRLIRFARNRGQGAALFRGLREAAGDVVITLDGDGQNHPGDIPALLQRLETADLVCGIRASRQDSFLRKAMSRLANAVRSRVLKDGVRDSGCALKAMRREVVQALLPLRTLYSFIPAQAAAAGFRIDEMPVRHRTRHGGDSNYGLKAFFWRPLMDMLGMAWYRKRCVLRPDDCRAADPRKSTR